MLKLSDLEKHLKKFDEISIEPEVTDIDKLIEQYDEIILENPKEEQIREYKDNQIIDNEFLNEQYIEMGKFYGKMVDVAKPKPKYETIEEKIVREIDRSKKPTSFKELEDNYLVQKFDSSADISNFSYELDTEKTFVVVMSIDTEELISGEFITSPQNDDLVVNHLSWEWDNKFNRFKWIFGRKLKDANAIFKTESSKVKKNKTYITFWKLDKKLNRVQIAINDESALSHRIDSDLYTSTNSYSLSMDGNISWNLYDLRIYDIYLNHKEQLMVVDELSKLHGINI
jgi:hypothetical protein